MDQENTELSEEVCVSGNQRKGQGNVLPLWGNERTMNLNHLILTNIQSSHYFKVNLYELKTYHEVIDEIYYKVNHLEPWEKGSRKTAGQTGMCGGVRGVGAGGIVSTAFCLLYKLFTLKLTRKQINGLIGHTDSAYLRSLGFMYLRYTQPPADLWEWFEPYLEDPEEFDVKAGGGQTMTIGEMLRHFLTKLDWFSTLFPRIPVPIQMGLEKKMAERFPAPVQQQKSVSARGGGGGQSAAGRNQRDDNNPRHIPDEELSFGEAERAARLVRANPDSGSGSDRYRSDDDRKVRDRHDDRRRDDSRSSSHHKSTDDRRHRRDESPRDKHRNRYRSRSRERNHDRHRRDDSRDRNRR